MLRALVCCLWIILTLSSVYAQSPLGTRIDSVLKSNPRQPFNGVICIVQGDQTLYNHVWGYANLNTREPVRRDSYFTIGSVSKQMTAVLVLQQVEKGKIELSDPLSTYLSGLNPAWENKVTIHHLLSHTHGIRATDQALAFMPGSQFEYSMTGYDLLGQILEKVTGQTFAALSASLFRQCGMHHTFHPDRADGRKAVNGYRETPDGDLAEDHSPTGPVPAGWFISTAGDLLLWNRHFYGGKLLHTETFQQLSTPQENAIREHPIFGTTAYGYGITIAQENGLLQWGQTGLAPGFVTMSFYFPATRTSLIILENIEYGKNIGETFYYHTRIQNILKNYLITK